MVSVIECYKFPCMIICNPKQQRGEACEEFSATCNCSSFGAAGRRRYISSARDSCAKESEKNLIVDESSDESSGWKPRSWADSTSRSCRKSEVQLRERKRESSMDMTLDERCWIQSEVDPVDRLDCQVGKEGRPQEEPHGRLIDFLSYGKAPKSGPRPSLKDEMLMIAKKFRRATRERKWQGGQLRSRSAKSCLQVPQTVGEDEGVTHIIAQKDVNVRSRRIQEAEEVARKNAKQKLALLRLQLRGEINAVYVTQNVSARRKVSIAEQELRKTNEDPKLDTKLAIPIDVGYPRSLKLVLEDVFQNNTFNKLEFEKFDPFEEGTDSDFYEVKVTALSNRLSQHYLALELMADHLEVFQSPDSELFTISHDKRPSFSNKAAAYQKLENGGNEKIEPTCRGVLNQANHIPVRVDTLICMVEEHSGQIGVEEVSFSRYIFH